MKIFAYYLAIVMLILFVGVVIYRLLFGSPCTMVGNFCVGDGWTIAGLAATILGVSATVLGILGAFALAAWWTDLDKKVRTQVDASMNNREETLNKRVDDILTKQKAQINEQFQAVLTNFSDRIAHYFAESDKAVNALSREIIRLRTEYEDINKMADSAKKIAVDAVTFGRPWNIEDLALKAVHEYGMIDVAVRMVDKYLEYIEGFLSATMAEKGKYMFDLKASGAPSASFPWFWDNVLRWQKEVNSFSKEHPETVKKVNEEVEKYQKRIDEARQNTAQ